MFVITLVNNGSKKLEPVVFIVGNKCDSGEQQKEVSSTEAEDYHRAFQFSQFLETSAKDGTNIYQLFMGTKGLIISCISDQIK